MLWIIFPQIILVARHIIVALQVLIPLLVYFTPLQTTAASGLRYRVVHRYPHDPRAFTEGLAICNGDLVESDGLYGHSRIVVRALHTGRLIYKRALPFADFGEGVTCAGGRIIQLTWRSGVAFLYDYMLRPLGEFYYQGQGWGIAYDEDDHTLVVSDGGAKLRFFRPSDFAPLGAVLVRDHGKPITQINELEWIGNRVFANIWHSSRIAIINPQTGVVTGWLNCVPLEKAVSRNTSLSRGDVLNGIAYDPETGHLFITGKRWPTLFEIALDDRQGK